MGQSPKTYASAAMPSWKRKRAIRNIDSDKRKDGDEGVSYLTEPTSTPLTVRAARAIAADSKAHELAARRHRKLDHPTQHLRRLQERLPSSGRSGGWQVPKVGKVAATTQRRTSPKQGPAQSDHSPAPRARKRSLRNGIRRIRAIDRGCRSSDSSDTEPSVVEVDVQQVAADQTAVKAPPPLPSHGTPQPEAESLDSSWFIVEKPPFPVYEVLDSEASIGSLIMVRESPPPRPTKRPRLTPNADSREHQARAVAKAGKPRSQPGAQDLSSGPVQLPKVQSKTQPKTQPKMQAAPKPNTRSQSSVQTTQPRAKVQPDPLPQPKPKTPWKATHEPRPRPKMQPEPKTEPKSKPKPQPTTRPQPKPKMEAEPKPLPQAKAKTKPTADLPSGSSSPEPMAGRRTVRPTARKAEAEALQRAAFRAARRGKEKRLPPARGSPARATRQASAMAADAGVSVGGSMRQRGGAQAVVATAIATAMATATATATATGTATATATATAKATATAAMAMEHPVRVTRQASKAKEMTATTGASSDGSTCYGSGESGAEGKAPTARAPPIRTTHQKSGAKATAAEEEDRPERSTRQKSRAKARPAEERAAKARESPERSTSRESEARPTPKPGPWLQRMAWPRVLRERGRSPNMIDVLASGGDGNK